MLTTTIWAQRINLLFCISHCYLYTYLVVFSYGWKGPYTVVSVCRYRYTKYVPFLSWAGLVWGTADTLWAGTWAGVSSGAWGAACAGAWGAVCAGAWGGVCAGAWGAVEAAGCAGCTWSESGTCTGFAAAKWFTSEEGYSAATWKGMGNPFYFRIKTSGRTWKLNPPFYEIVLKSKNTWHANRTKLRFYTWNNIFANVSKMS